MANQSTKNHLSKTQSPYLLQHAENPVHWFSWSDEAFDAAKKQDKPIFLSIGYATCHWCHVMAHESFEDEAVAKMMNEAFINIKVDREERPDIDHTYMQVCQMLTGRGGWPLTIVMTPGKKPFYAATYLPKSSRRGQPGLTELIPRLRGLWNEEREKIEGSARKITQAFQETIKPKSHGPLPENILVDTRERLQQQFDETYGGFGDAPKFPSPHTLIFLLRYARAFDDKKANDMAGKTLVSMANGGIFDQLAGGFHRYSTDRRWLLPHFEKMLYDQAMHLLAYSEAWQSLRNPLFKRTAQGVASYLLRDLQDEGGAFYSAEDADSEGGEGAFYLWTVDEIRDALPSDDAKLAIEIFNLNPEGNFRDEATGQPTEKNILHVEKCDKDLAAEHDTDLSNFSQKIGEIRCRLFGYRAKRERPFLDDKILADWNGLTVAALAKAGRVLNELKYIDQAERAISFIFKHLMTKNGRLLHRYRKGEAAVDGTADDYAFLIWGLLELYESTFETTYLQKALKLQKTFLQTHWDEQHGGFFFTPQESETLLGRKKEYFDGAMPSGNSAAMMNLLRLGRLCEKPEWSEKAEKIAQPAAEVVGQMPSSFTQLLQAHLWTVQPSQEIVISGEKDTKETRQFLKEARRFYMPQSVVLLHDPNDEEIETIAPFIKHQPMIDGKPTAYVCRNYTCREPTHDIEKFIQLLSDYG
jgi:uncharacterized protein YyaL (SSP411 family)